MPESRYGIAPHPTVGLSLLIDERMMDGWERSELRVLTRMETPANGIMRECDSRTPAR